MANPTSDADRDKAPPFPAGAMQDGRPQLAIRGGPPLLPEGPPDWPLPDPQVRAALEAVARDGSWGRYHGPHVEQLEIALARQHAVPHALTCNSGTFAVELALRAVPITAGDEVILAGYDFPGNFRAIEAVGARPALVDIDPDTWCLDPNHLADAVAPATRAILVSHLHGGLADIRAIREFAQQHGLAVIEDACQAPGAEVQGRRAGTWGDVGVLSFGGSKLLTAGRGGAILTSREDCLQRAKIFCERGNDAFALSEMQAAVLLPQLSQLDERNAKRRRSIDRLVQACPATEPLRPVANRVAGAASYYKHAWRLTAADEGSQFRETFVAAVRAEGVALDAGFRGFTRRGPRRCRRLGSLEHSARAAVQTVLLHHPVLLQADSVLDRVGEAIAKVAAALQAF